MEGIEFLAVSTGAMAFFIFYVLPVFILASSIWVYFDAKAIGARKGLMNGLADMGPFGWFAVTIGMWIIGFPAYLAMRPKIKMLVQNKQTPITVTKPQHPESFSHIFDSRLPSWLDINPMSRTQAAVFSIVLILIAAGMFFIALQR